MRKILLVAALSLVAATAGCSKSDTADATPVGAKAEAKLQTMTIDEVDQALASKQVQAADCNHEQLRKRLGVLPGAILINDTEGYAATELPADKATKLVFYCADPG